MPHSIITITVATSKSAKETRTIPTTGHTQKDVLKVVCIASYLVSVLISLSEKKPTVKMEWAFQPFSS